MPSPEPTPRCGIRRTISTSTLQSSTLESASLLGAGPGAPHALELPAVNGLTGTLPHCAHGWRGSNGSILVTAEEKRLLEHHHVDAAAVEASFFIYFERLVADALERVAARKRAASNSPAAPAAVLSK